MSLKEAKRIVVRGGRLIDPARGIDKLGDLLIEDGKILLACAKVDPKSHLDQILADLG